MFGQFVIGPPGSGKTTYTHAMQQMCLALKRPYLIINLDPANDELVYAEDYVPADEAQARQGQAPGPLKQNDPNISNLIDVRELIQADEVMEMYDLGPNGALVHCMEYIEANLDWLIDQIRSVGAGGDLDDAEEYLAQNPAAQVGSDSARGARGGSQVISYEHRYLIFDCPGQVELYIHSDVMNKITARLQKEFDMEGRLTCVHLIDSSLCLDLGSYLSALLTSQTATLHLEMPHVNVLTKIDLAKDFGRDLDFRLEHYLRPQRLGMMLEAMEAACGYREAMDKARKAAKEKAEQDGDVAMQKELAHMAFCEARRTRFAFGEQEVYGMSAAEAGKALRCFQAPSARMLRQWRAFYGEICDLIDRHGHTACFEPLEVNDRESVLRVLITCDTANGRVHIEKAAHELEKAEREKKGKAAGDTTQDDGSSTDLQDPKTSVDRGYYALFNCMLEDREPDYMEYVERLQEKYFDRGDTRDDAEKQRQEDLGLKGPSKGPGMYGGDEEGADPTDLTEEELRELAVE